MGALEGAGAGLTDEAGIERRCEVHGCVPVHGDLRVARCC